MTRQVWLSVALALLAAVIIAVFCLGYRVGLKKGRYSPNLPDNVKVDTLYIRDTITQIKPVSVRFRAIDTIKVAVRDTIRERDTLYLPMLREQIVWRDSLAEVYASGIMPSVDSVRHYRQAEIRTITLPPVEVVRRTRWGVGIQAGYGVTLSSGQVKAAPYVGVGVSYNIIAW